MSTFLKIDTNHCSTNFYPFAATLTATITASSCLSDAVRMMAAKYEKTAAQIFFKFLQSQRIMVLSGTKNEVHMLQVPIVFFCRSCDALFCA